MCADRLLRCPLCRADALHFGADEVHCSTCDAEFPLASGVPILVRDPALLSANIDEARRVNPAWYDMEQPPEEASPWRHHLKKRRIYVEGLLRRRTEECGKITRLLDLGCGDGNNLAWLRHYAVQVYGCDYNAVRLARARARFPDVALFLGDILDLPVNDGAFDVIFFNHVIEHIPDDVAALAAVKRILAPDGLLVLGTPNEGAWWWQLAYRRAPELLASTDHVHFYTANKIAEKMEAAGFDVAEIKHMGWGPPDWRIDGRIRGYKFVDDAFEFVGKRLFAHQASSLYVLATQGNHATMPRLSVNDVPPPTCL